MLTTGVVVICGCLAAAFSPRPIDSFWFSFIPLALCLAWFSAKTQRYLFLMIAAFLWAGLGMHQHSEQRLENRWNNKRLLLEGEVVNIPRKSGFNSRFLFRVETEQQKAGLLDKTIRLSWRDAPEALKAGQRWRLLVKLKRPHGFHNEGGFDYERWLFVNGISATGYVVASQNQLLKDASLFTVNRLREKVSESIDHNCIDCANSGLMKALSIGYRGDIPANSNRLLQQTGTAHLLAISGLHVGIVASLFYVFGGWVWLIVQKQPLRKLLGSSFKPVFFTPGKRDLALVSACFGALLYSLMSGFALPTQRALIMTLVVALIYWMRLPFNLLHSIFLTVTVVMVYAPLSVLSASFWMTFNALLIISLGAFLLRSGRKWYALLLIQGLFSLLFIPISLLVFGEMHPASFIANLLAVPLVSLVVVPFNFLIMVFSWLPSSLLEMAYFALDQLLSLLMIFLQYLLDYGLSARSIAHHFYPVAIALVVVILLMVMPSGLMNKKFLLSLPVPMLLAFPYVPKTDTRSFQVDVLDVGQGTSLVVQTAAHTVVYDFGDGRAESYSLGQWVVQPFLKSRGLYPDLFVISHADIDHYGGLLAIHDQFPGVPIETGNVEKITGMFGSKQQIENCHQREDFYFDGVRFHYFALQKAANTSDNNQSCVLAIELGETRVLISGDIESQRESELIQQDADRLASEVLIAPHHGSSTSSSVEFVQAVSAATVIFTSGYFNRWNFPRAEVVNRYLQSGARVINTAESGQVRIRCDEVSCKTTESRKQSPRIWY